MPAPGAVYRTSPPYEFAAKDKEVFTRLASALSFCGIFSYIAAAFEVLAGASMMVIGAVGPTTSAASQGVSMKLLAVCYLALAPCMVFFGLYMVRAAEAARRVGTTSGDDVPAVMDATENLRKLFSFWRGFIIATMVLMVLACLGGMTIGFFSGLSRAHG